ncbi:MAG: cbb3-type cytochrome c oxidase subunit 3 [Hyphomicrobiaceae bacterium]
MSYHVVASLSQVTSLLMFIAIFVAVLAYALWPSNGPRFEAAQRSALDLDSKQSTTNARHDRGAK